MRKLINISIAAFLVLLATSCEKETNDINGTLIENDINTTTTWTSGNTYIISGTINVDDAVLTIEPGTTIKFESGARLDVGYYGNATLIANGTAEKPITFTSNAASPSAGAWEGITFWSHSLNSSMTYCNVEYAGKTSEGAVNLRSTSIVFSNNQVKYAKEFGIELDYESSFDEMNSNTFSNCGSHPVRLCAAYMHTIGTGNTFNCADGYGVNVISGDATGIITWKKLDKPYYIEGEVDVNNATLTIEPGAIFKFNTDGSLHFGYYNSTTLIANGTSTENIVFTSSASTPTAGAWRGITLWGNTLTNTSINYCDVNYAGKSADGAFIVKETGITLNNCNIHNSSSAGIVMNDGAYFTSMDNNTIENIATHALEIDADRVGTIGSDNIFTCNNGYGINVTDGDVNIVSTWKKQTVPYYINVDLDVEANLTIQPGAILMFGTDGQMDIGYYNNTQVTAVGTSSEPIVFTSAATSPAAGAWKGILIWENNSPNTRFDYCEFNYTGKDVYESSAAIWTYNTSFTVTNSKFQYSAGYGIFLDSGSTVTNTGNTFTGCALGEVGQSD